MVLEILESVPSTMDVARENVLLGRVVFDVRGRPNYEAVLAREQTAGRGQRGRVWYAPPGEAFCATYYFRRDRTDPQHVGEIALLAGVAVVEALRSLLCPLAPNTMAGAPEIRQVPPALCLGLKWPNDVTLNGKKLAGILIEMVKAPDGKWTALIGIGINLGQRAFPPEFAASATSLALEGALACDWQTLGLRIAEALHAEADRLCSRGFPALLQRWRAYDQTPGRRYETQIDGVTLQGIALGVNAVGALRLQLEDGREVAVTTATSVR